METVMSRSVMAPHLAERDGEKLCSACGRIFPVDGEITISRAFAAHVKKDHPRPALKTASESKGLRKTER